MTDCNHAFAIDYTADGEQRCIYCLKFKRDLIPISFDRVLWDQEHRITDEKEKNAFRVGCLFGFITGVITLAVMIGLIR